MNDKINVMMSTEGTYPFHHGGVSTWCDILVKNTPNNMNMILYSIIMNPFVTQKFNLPKNSQLIKVPLWGTEEPSEHLDLSFSEIYVMKKRTTDKIIKDRFLPLFTKFINEIVSINKDPENFGKIINDMYNYFKVYEYKKSFKSEVIWNEYKKFIFQYTDKKENKMSIPGVYSIIQSLGWIYRFMTVLNTPVPKVNVTHSAAAAFCGIPCVIAKLQYKAPFILTEHGIYLREQYLTLSKRGYPPFLNTFLIRMIHSIVSLNYYYADQVSPVCSYNTRWEKKFKVNQDKIQVIYNGVDEKIFMPRQSEKKDCITIVSVARIDPAKDIITLLQTASIIIKKFENVKFLVYGSVSVQGYYEECISFKEKLDLGDKFIFAGHTNDVASTYNSGDIIVLSSITEAFPYSVVEAMMSGKPVVSTDVGGIKEALGDCGILVAPGNPEEMAQGIGNLIENEELRNELGTEGRERALNFFTINKAEKQYYDSYLRWSLTKESTVEKENMANVSNFARRKQSLLIDKAFALFDLKLYSEAIEQLRMAIQVDVSSPAVPVILSKIAEAYKCIGNYVLAENELKKIEILKEIIS